MSAGLLPAALYHAQHAAYLDDLPYWQSLVDRCPRPALEAGCGTGRITLPLLASGRQVWGLDNDPHMLAYLRRRLTAAQAAALRLVEADMASFAAQQVGGQQFGLIFVPCNTISTLAEADRRSAFANFHSRLLAEGLFAASLPNPLLLADLEPQPEAELEDEFPHPQSGDPVQLSASYWTEGRDFVLNWHYDLLSPDGRVERITVSQRQHLLTPQEWQAQLHQAGFEVVALWGDFDQSPYGPDSPHLVWEARPVAG